MMKINNVITGHSKIFPKEKTLQNLFEEQVNHTPDNIALRFQDQQLSYSELNNKANQLAHYIKASIDKPLNPDSLIAISFDKSLEMIIAIIAILKLGVAYLPIDVNCPAQRAQYMLAEAEVDLLLTQSHLKAKLQKTFAMSKKSVLAIDKLSYTQANNDNLSSTNKSNNLAYVIYTSGTTGTPKGVMVEHHSVINMAMAHADELVVDENSIVLQFASIFFDASVWEIFTALLTGACLTIIPEQIRKDPTKTVNFLAQEKISVAAFSPAFLAEFPVQALPHLKTLMIGGETPSEHLVKNWSKDRRFINAYGPTEATVCSNLNHYKKNDAVNNIGKPLQNVSLAISDSGELLIAGAGLARGYLKQPALTKEKFINIDSLGRCYRTGDKVELQQDGSLLFLGRVDFQVKLHGFRIELTEIERQLLEYPGIQQACILLQKQAKHEFLTAFYTSKKSLKNNELKQFLEKTLPDYMLPKYFVQLETFPLTANGKIDREAFPIPEISGKTAYQAPNNKTEKEIQRIWQQAFGIKQLGINEDFFCLGGNSILAIQVLKQINEQLHTNLSIVDFYQEKTIKAIAAVITDKQKKVTTEKIIEKDQLAPTEKMILRDHYASESKLIYNESLVVDLPNNYQISLLKKHLTKLLKVFPNLRANYQLDSNRIIKTTAKKAVLVFEQRNESTEADFKKIIPELVAKPFDLEDDSLIRFYLFELNGKQKLLIVFFHAIMDGSSVVNLLLSQLNNLITNDKANDITSSKQAHAKFCQELYSLYENDFDNKLAYWQSIFERSTPCQLADLATTEVTAAGKQIAFKIDSDRKQQLDYIAEKLSVSLFDVLLATFFLLLKKYSQQENLIIRTNIDERVYLPEYASVAGCFINNTFLHASVDEKQSLVNFIKQVAVNKQQAITNPLSYEQLLVNCREQLDNFSTIHFNIEPEAQQADALFQTQTLVHSGQVKNDLYFELDIKNIGIFARVEYKDTLFSSELIKRLIDSYQLLIDELTENLNKPLTNLSPLSGEQYNLLVNEWNQTEYEFTGANNLVERFQSQVQKTPNATALVFCDKTLSYKELNNQANQLAHYLQDYFKLDKIKPANRFIALCMDRSVEMMVAMLATLKLGAAYIPIDPQLPEERISYLLEDSKPLAILSQSFIKLPQVEQRFDLDKLDCSAAAIHQLNVEIAPKTLAYVIYTSGTTGQPKGVMLTHQAVVNRIAWMQKQYPIDESDVVMQKTPYSFDVSVWEFFWAHWYGAKLVMLKPEGHKQTDYLLETIQQHQVTVMHFVPSLLAVFLEGLNKATVDSLALRHIFCSGEALLASSVNLFNQLFVKHVAQIHNLYGPTEAAIDVSFYDCPKDYKLTSIPIGKPINNIRLYVLDSNLKPVPVGVSGELHISGIGLANGYLNKPELTEEKFIANPFYQSDRDNECYQRLYKTGDLVHYLPDGNIDYIGRNDFQVKLRGFRIELGDIESALLSYTGIKQACILLNDQQLYAFYTAEKAIKQSDLEVYLLEKLPDYMVPKFFIAIEKMPLTANGKLDRKALLTLSQNNNISTEVSNAPMTPLEEQLALIWQEVLGINQLDIMTDFFALGGDSISAIRLVNRMKSADFYCRVADIFKYRNIKSLATFLTKNRSNQIESNAEQGLLSGEFPLLPIQQWFFQQVSNNSIPTANHWNQAFWVTVDNLDLSRLQTALTKLVDHHDSLRLIFKKKGDVYQQIYQQIYQQNFQVPEIVSVNCSTFTDSDLEKPLAKLNSGFDLFTGPLWRVAYFSEESTNNGRLYFACHHLLIDTVSWQIVVEDLKTLYENKPLPAKTTSYRQAQLELINYVKANPSEKAYWQTECKIANQVSLSIVEKDHLSNYCLELSTELTTQLLLKTNNAYHTETNDLLLAAFALAVKTSQAKDIVAITLEGHGREQLTKDIDLSRTVGWFTTLYPVCLENQATLAETIKTAKEKLRNIPNKGIGFGAFSYLEHNTTLTEALPSIFFNYLGNLDSSKKDWSISADHSNHVVAIKNQKARLLDINLWIESGKLNISVVSASSKLSAKELTITIKERIEEIICHCQNIIEHEANEFTPSDFPLVNLTQQQLDNLQDKARNMGNKVEAIYPANSLQQGLLYHALSQPEDDAYHVQVLFNYECAIDKVFYEQAWQLAINQFPALRTAFSWEEEILQIIYQNTEFKLEYQDLSSLDTQAQDDVIDNLLAQDRAERFDLSKPGLIRVYLLKRNETLYSLLRSEHHSVMDGWSGPQLLLTVQQFYQQLVNNKNISVTVDQAYVNAQAYYADHQQQAIEFWKEKQLDKVTANDLNPLLSNSYDLDKFKAVSKPATEKVILTDAIYQSIKQLTHEQGLTVSSILQFCWHRLLQTFTQAEHTIVGTIVSGRELPIPNIESSVGLYINALPLLVDWSHEVSLLEQIENIQRDLVSSTEYGFINLANLQIAGKRLFHSLFIFENYPQLADDKNTLNISLQRFVEKLDYPLTLIAYESNNQLALELSYDERILDSDLVKQHLQRLQLMLESIPNKLKQPWWKLNLLTTEESQLIFNNWNETKASYPEEKTIIELFQQQVEKTPNNIAVSFDNSSLSYAELNQLSTLLAKRISKYLKSKKSYSQTPLVAVCFERSLSMMVVLLAILKADAAYIPIDPSYPEKRIDSILTESKCSLLLLQEDLDSINGLEKRLSNKPKVIYFSDKEINQHSSLVE